MNAKTKLSEQSKEFLRVAKEIGADDKKSAADTLMRRLAHTPPNPKAKPKSKKKKAAK